MAAHTPTVCVVSAWGVRGRPGWRNNWQECGRKKAPETREEERLSETSREMLLDVVKLEVSGTVGEDFKMLSDQTAKPCQNNSLF